MGIDVEHAVGADRLPVDTTIEEDARSPLQASAPFSNVPRPKAMNLRPPPRSTGGRTKFRSGGVLVVPPVSCVRTPSAAANASQIDPASGFGDGIRRSRLRY